MSQPDKAFHLSRVSGLRDDEEAYIEGEVRLGAVGADEGALLTLVDENVAIINLRPWLNLSDVANAAAARSNLGIISTGGSGSGITQQDAIADPDDTAISASSYGTTEAAVVRSLRNTLKEVLAAMRASGVIETAHLNAGLNANTVDWLTRATGTYSSTYQLWLDDLVTGLKAKQLWSTLDLLVIPAFAKNTGDKLLSLISTNYDGTAVNSLSFVEGQGITTSSSAYVNTNFNPDSASSASYQLNSATIGCYVRTDGGLEGIAMGSGSSGGTNPTTQLISSSNGNSGGQVNYASDWFRVSNSNKTGLFTLSRTASNLTTLYRNKSSLGSNNSASDYVPRGPFFVGASDDNFGVGTHNPVYPSGNQYSMYFVASGWTSQHVSDFCDLTIATGGILQRLGVS